jgi:alpha-glucosidase
VVFLIASSGTDIQDLVLQVQYQAKERLNVKIYPKYLSVRNETHYILPNFIVRSPESDDSITKSKSDLGFEWRYGYLTFIPCIYEWKLMH